MMYDSAWKVKKEIPIGSARCGTGKEAKPSQTSGALSEVTTSPAYLKNARKPTLTTTATATAFLRCAKSVLASTHLPN